VLEPRARARAELAAVVGQLFDRPTETRQRRTRGAPDRGPSGAAASAQVRPAGARGRPWAVLQGRAGWQNRKTPLRPRSRARPGPPPPPLPASGAARGPKGKGVWLDCCAVAMHARACHCTTTVAASPLWTARAGSSSPHMFLRDQATCTECVHASASRVPASRAGTCPPHGRPKQLAARPPPPAWSSQVHRRARTPSATIR
jgi:hypothetical protein